MNNAAERAAQVRRTAGCFALEARGLVQVGGADRVRWTNGMVSNDVSQLVPGPTRSGCHALLLTPQGRIVADLHVLARETELWLELDRAALPEALARLERSVIADDVVLGDASARWDRLALEGPRAPDLLVRLAGGPLVLDPLALAPDCGVELAVAGATWLACAWGWSGEPAFQLFVPSGAGAAASAALRAAADFELVDGDPAALEVLRIEAGTPAFGSELGPDTLPAEAGLVGRAVSLEKGCYTGQEIVARMASRGSASHRLVGFRLGGRLESRPQVSRSEPQASEGGPLHVLGDAAALPPRGAPVAAGGERVGTLTSVCRSAHAGSIGLGYVRRAHAAPDTLLEIDGAPARVAPLPFVAGSR